MATNKKSTKNKATRRKRSRITADPFDFRDRVYLPPVRVRPPVILHPRKAMPILDQEETSACTGFALATLVHWLLDTASVPADADRVSPFMLYSMARRYDEFPGAKADTGSSLRGALKGWHKHGACRADLWPRLDMPPVPDDPKDDWWSDAVRRPLGAYYRVDPQELAAMHVALDEVGIPFASVVCHAGWDEGYDVTTREGEYWAIPQRRVSAADSGHAFTIIGYTDEGFIVHNSWGTGWGSQGLGLLTYRDWRENAMDCWVAQMGVVTTIHLAIAESATLRRVRGRVEVAQEEKLRNHEIAPYVVNMENNGRLSESGDFRTQPGDVEALVTTYLERARAEWQLGDNDAIDIAIYAHGGLTSEADAADAASRWIPALYEQRIFPIFFMWETGLLSTLENMVKDAFEAEPRRVAGLQRWWDERLERALARPGTAIWGEMKENGAAISGAREARGSKESGGVLLYKFATASPVFNPARDRLHLIGHSAGSIVHCYLLDALVEREWSFASANMMAPAATVDLFAEKMLPHVMAKTVRQYNQWHLSYPLEAKDPTCRAILGYGRSLLYLVSESFEGGSRTPLVGMQKYYDGIDGPDNMRAWSAVSTATASTTHGGFDNDAATLGSVIRCIKEASR